MQRGRGDYMYNRGGGGYASRGRMQQVSTRGSPQTGYGYVPGLGRRGGAIPSPPHCDPCAPCLEGGRAKVRVVSGVLNAPEEGYDVSIQGITQFKGVFYKEYTQYTWVSAGAVKFNISVSGLVDEKLWPEYVLGENNPYTLIIFGDANTSDPTSPNKLQTMLIRDHHIRTQKGYANVQLVHASPNTPSMDLLLDNEHVFSNVKYGDLGMHGRSSYAGIPVVNPTTNKPYKNMFSLTQSSSSTGTVSEDEDDSDSSSSITFIKSTQIPLCAGHIYTFFVFGVYNDSREPLLLVITQDWPESKPELHDVDEDHLTVRELSVRNALRKEVQRSDAGVNTLDPTRGDLMHDVDEKNGFSFANVPVGQLIATPIDHDLSMASDQVFQLSAVVRLIHSLTNVKGVSMSIEEEPVVKNLKKGQVTEPLSLYPGKYNVKLYTDNKLVAEQKIGFKQGTIYTIVGHNDTEGDLQLSLHSDTPDVDLSHVKVISLSKVHGNTLWSATKSHRESGMYPLTIFSGNHSISDPIFGPRSVHVPERSHVTVFMIDDDEDKDDKNGAVSVFTQNYRW